MATGDPYTRPWNFVVNAWDDAFNKEWMDRCVRPHSGLSKFPSSRSDGNGNLGTQLGTRGLLGTRDCVQLSDTGH